MGAKKHSKDQRPSFRSILTFPRSHEYQIIVAHCFMTHPKMLILKQIVMTTPKISSYENDN